MAEATTSQESHLDKALLGMSPYCLAQVEVLFNIKGRPYWRCWRCEVRSFGTKATLHSVRSSGWRCIGYIQIGTRAITKVAEDPDLFTGRGTRRFHHETYTTKHQ